MRTLIITGALLATIGAAAQDIPKVTTTCRQGSPTLSDCPTGSVTFCSAVWVPNDGTREERRLWLPRSDGSCHLGDKARLAPERKPGRMEIR